MCLGLTPTCIQCRNCCWTSCGSPCRLDLSILALAVQHYFKTSLYTQNVPSSHETILLLHLTQHIQPLSPLRTTTLLLRYLPRCKAIPSRLVNPTSPPSGACRDPRELSSLPVLKRVQVGISRARLLKGSPDSESWPITSAGLETPWSPPTWRGQSCGWLPVQLCWFLPPRRGRRVPARIAQSI